MAKLSFLNFHYKIRISKFKHLIRWYIVFWKYEFKYFWFLEKLKTKHLVLSQNQILFFCFQFGERTALKLLFLWFSNKVKVSFVHVLVLIFSIVWLLSDCRELFSHETFASRRVVTKNIELTTKSIR
jgi:hypothetical protein